MQKWLRVAEFYNAAQSGDEATIEKLIAEGVDPDLSRLGKISPLNIAAGDGNRGVVRLLLDTQAVDVDSKRPTGCSPIFSAAASGFEDIVELLLSSGGLILVRI
jgi:ankyrin repeat protein